MPLGSFMAQSRDPRPKKDKPIREKKEELPVQIPHEEPEYVARIRDKDSWNIRILVLGRNASSACDFLCSVSENMTKAMHQAGLTYYTTEANTIKNITETKIRLERHFWSFNSEPWQFCTSEESGNTFTFCISPSGNQTKAITLEFVCFSCESDGEPPYSQADAVWFLADAPSIDSELVYDKHRAFIQQELSRCLSGSADGTKPVCLLLSQIEKYGHFKSFGEQSVLDTNVRSELLKRCREYFSFAKGSEVAVIPLQVYGGLEYVGINGNGEPLLTLSRSGYYQSYIPENCQIPCFYTVDRITAAQNIDIFEALPCGGIKRVISRHYAEKTGKNDWHPDMLAEVTSNER